MGSNLVRVARWWSLLFVFLILRQFQWKEPHCVLLALLFQDVPLISLANIFHNAKLWNDAIIVATMAVEIAPHFVVNHFTLANVYVAMVSMLPLSYVCLWYIIYVYIKIEFSRRILKEQN